MYGMVAACTVDALSVQLVSGYSVARGFRCLRDLGIFGLHRTACLAFACLSSAMSILSRHIISSGCLIVDDLRFQHVEFFRE